MAQIVDSTVSFALYSAVLYLSGVLVSRWCCRVNNSSLELTYFRALRQTGSAFFSGTVTHIHPFGGLIAHDTAAWHAFGQIPLGGSPSAWATDGTMGGPASGVGEAVQFWLNR